MGIEADDKPTTTDAEPTIEDALNDAIGPASDAPEEPTDAHAPPEPKGDEHDEPTDAGEEGGEDKPDDTDDGEAVGDDKPGDDAESGDNGKPKDAEAEDKPSEQEPAEISDDDIEAGLKDRSRQRFQQLRQEANAGNEWQKIITQIGASPEDLAGSLEVLRLAKAGQAKEALTMLDQQRADLARAAGEEVPGVDLLSEYPDLKQRVDEGDIERADALDVAKARRTQQAADQQRQQQGQQQQQAQQMQQRQQAAVSKLDALGAQLQARDADFAERFAAMQKEVIPWMAENLPPEQWEAAFMQQYNLLGTRPAVKREKPTRPLSGSGQGASGAKPEPKSMEEAIAFSIGNGD